MLQIEQRFAYASNVTFARGRWAAIIDVNVDVDIRFREDLDVLPVAGQVQGNGRGAVSLEGSKRVSKNIPRGMAGN
jgi:hypothetical protein